MKKNLIGAVIVTAIVAGAQVAQAQDCNRELASCNDSLATCTDILDNNCRAQRGNATQCQFLCERTRGVWSNGACGCPEGRHLARGNPCRCVPDRPRGADREPRPVVRASGERICPPGTSAAGSEWSELDRDCDGVGALDNCPRIHNPDQENMDGDALGAACDDRDDLALHAGDLDPLARRIAAVEEALANMSAGESLPAHIRQTLIERWSELIYVLDQFNTIATTVGDHTRLIAALRTDLDALTGRVDGLQRRVEALEIWRNDRVDPTLDRLDRENIARRRENRRQETHLTDIDRMLAELREGQARVFQYFWLDGAYMAFPGEGASVSALMGELGLRVAQFGPFAVSGSIGFGQADNQFAYYVGGLGEFLLNRPSRPVHVSLGIGFAVFANELAPFEDDQFGWRGVYIEPTLYIRLGDEDAPRLRISVRGGLGQSFYRQQAATGWTETGMIGGTVGIAIPGML